MNKYIVKGGEIDENGYQEPYEREIKIFSPYVIYNKDIMDDRYKQRIHDFWDRWCND
jgi:hypothetical protein